MTLFSAHAAFSNSLNSGGQQNLFAMLGPPRNTSLAEQNGQNGGQCGQCQQSAFVQKVLQSTTTKTQPPIGDAGMCSGTTCGGTQPNGALPQAPIPPGQPQAQQAVPASPCMMKQADDFYINSMVPDSKSAANPIYYQGDATETLQINVATPSMSNGDTTAIRNANLTTPKAVPVTGVESWVRTALTTAAKVDMRHSLPRQVANAEVQQQQQARVAAEAAADGAEATEAASLNELFTSLINVANENASIPCSAQQSTKNLPQAIWMVQQMFHQCYIPMAILLLLPGAVMTQMKGMVQFGMFGASEESDPDAAVRATPFTGIFRSIIAIFLIPATQLIVSWMVDIGNSMTYEVEKYLVPATVFNWAKEQTYNPPTQNDENVLDTKPGDDSIIDSAQDATEPDVGAGVKPRIQGPPSNGTEAHSAVRDSTLMSEAMETLYNMVAFSLAAAFGVLVAFQTVMMCYLFLLGPIAAAFYAWPSGIGSLFKKIFINWVDAVINLSLWRFWWVVVVLIMYVRITTLQALGEYQPNNQWETAMYTAFMVIICYVPFMPFEFRPGEMVGKVLEKAEQAGKGGGGGGGGQENAGSGQPGKDGQSPVTPQQPGPKNTTPANGNPKVNPPPPANTPLPSTNSNPSMRCQNDSPTQSSGPPPLANV
jgi:hypothetical protein